MATRLPSPVCTSEFPWTCLLCATSGPLFCFIIKIYHEIHKVLLQSRAPCVGLALWRLSDASFTLLCIRGIWGKEAPPCARGCGTFNTPARISTLAQGSFTTVGPLCEVFVPRLCADRAAGSSPSQCRWIRGPIHRGGGHPPPQRPPDVTVVKENCFRSTGCLLGTSRNFAFITY